MHEGTSATTNGSDIDNLFTKEPAYRMTNRAVSMPGPLLGTMRST